MGLLLGSGCLKRRVTVHKRLKLIVPPDFSEDEDGNPDDQGDAGNYQDRNNVVFDDLEEIVTQ